MYVVDANIRQGTEQSERVMGSEICLAGFSK
jgi:hypothetical protein